MFTSTIQVLKVEREDRKSQKTGNEYQHFAARCILLNDDGEVETVGTINSRRISPELRESIAPGTFRAVFGLRVPDFGNDKGDVMAILTGLTPVPGSKPAAPAPTPAPAPAKA